MAPKEQESVIMDMWEVPPGRQQELIDQLRELPDQARRTDGFVDGRIHASLDGSRVVSYSTMRSAADHQSFQERDEIHERMQALEAIAVPTAAPTNSCACSPPRLRQVQRRSLPELSDCSPEHTSRTDLLIARC